MQLMLAEKSTANLTKFIKNNPQFILEAKRDGIRCLLVWDQGNVQLINRSGRDITKDYAKLSAEITRTMARLSNNSVTHLVFDGEIVCTVNGADNFREAVRLDSPHEKTYVAFDIVEYTSGGSSLREGATLAARAGLRRALFSLGLFPFGGPVQEIKTIPHQDAETWMRHPGHEGLIAKNPRAPYTPGRSKEWLKFKRVESETFLVGGLEPGNGERAHTFGALLLVDPKTMKYAGKVGSGFTAQDLQDILLRWNDFTSGKSPDPVLVEVEFDARSRADGGVLRFPVFKGIRGQDL